MYQMMIVDDKDDIINGIRTMGQWADLGVEITGWAHDGEEALQVITAVKPQLLITDIKMPIMDGIQLTERVKKLYPEIKVIILSGYDEFLYAQQALKLGAEDYLLKPIRIEQLREVVMRVIGQLAAEQARQLEEANLLERLTQSLPLLRDKFWQQLLEEPNSFNISTVLQRLDFLKIDLDLNYLAVLVIEIDQYIGMVDRNSYWQAELVRQNLEELKEDFNRGNQSKSIIFADQKERFGWILSFPEDRQSRKELQMVLSLAETISCFMREKTGVTVSIGIGRFYGGILQLFHSYQEANEALSHKFRLGAQQIIHIDDVLPDQKLSFHYPLELEKKLLFALKTGAGQEGLNILDLYFTALEQYAGCSPKLIKKSLFGFISALARTLMEMNIDEKQVTENGEDLLTGITRWATLEEVKLWIRKVVEKVCWLSCCEKKNKVQLKMEKAKAYIREHIATEISLQKVAGSIDLSPNYFTTLFKEYTGETFMDYVIRIRIDKAKELLGAGQFKVYEVANQVGYNDARYFSEIFKKYVGMAPAEYLKQ